MSLPTNFFMARGLVGAVPGFTSVSGNAGLDSVGGVDFYVGTHTFNNTSSAQMTITTAPGGQFYVGLLGASGGSYNAGQYSGGGGWGVALVTVPAGVTQMILVMGGAGGSSNGQAPGGLPGGGYGGSPHPTFGASQGGGGYTGLFKTSVSHANAVVMVGSGGGSGNNNGSGGGGGAINGSGSDSSIAATDGGRGASTSSGGAAATNSPGYTSGNQQAGSALQGGNGSDSSYDAGAGGGAGYYGGGGGRGGGGYDGGAGGGGSGYIDTSTATIIATGAGYTDASTGRAPDLQAQVRTTSGASAFAFSANYGKPRNSGVSNGFAGFGIIWNVT